MKPLNAEQADLAAKHVRFVHYVVRRVSLPFYCSYDDAVAEGMLGLMRATLTYDPKKGAFTTYAWKPIYSSIVSYLRKAKSSYIGSIETENDWEPLIRYRDSEWRKTVRDLVEDCPDPGNVIKSTVFETFGFNEMSAAQIAQVDGVTDSAVYHRLQQFKNYVLGRYSSCSLLSLPQ